jgi:hypothetical protein
MVTAVLAAAVIAGSAAVPASGIGSAVTRRGECDGPSRWALTVRSVDAGALRVRLVIVGGAEGEDWNVFMDDNGVGFFSGSRTSRADGLVVVRRRTGDRAGTDRITAGAHDTATGETCNARAAFG